MTDEKYTFVETQRERKNIAHSASARKIGSKSKYCSLPSDTLTHAQWKRRNGPVKTTRLTEPMTWQQFRELKKDLQLLYLDGLVQRFGVNQQTVAKDLFGIKSGALSSYCHRKDITLFGDKPRSNLTGEAEERWLRWCCGEEQDKNAPEEAPEIEDTLCEVTEAPQCASKQPAIRTLATPETGMVSYHGRAGAICEALFQLLGSEAEYDIKITFLKGDTDNGREDEQV